MYCVDIHCVYMLHVKEIYYSPSDSYNFKKVLTLGCFILGYKQLRVALLKFTATTEGYFTGLAYITDLDRTRYLQVGLL